MSKVKLWISVVAVMCLCANVPAQTPTPAQTKDPTEIEWPREFEKDGKKLTVYQPQVDEWKNYTTMHVRCAVSVEGVLKEERFGVVEMDARTLVDHATRLVAFTPVKRDIRFAKATDIEQAQLKAAIEELNPMDRTTIIALDRVVACLDASKQNTQRPVEVNLDPPRIVYSSRDAVMVIFMGKPIVKPVAPDRTDLQFVVNTNWDILYDFASRTYYLLVEDGWMSASDLLKGPWTAAKSVPASFVGLPVDENWTQARKNLSAKPLENPPTVFTSTEPAELLVTEGRPQFRQIGQTQLSQVSNTESTLFFHAGESKFYFLTAGRWFSAADPAGPWAAASKSLPADFSNIPDDDEASVVKASVPGTRDAADAVLLASVPNSTVVDIKNEKPVQVTYSGEPKFVPITNTTVSYATNTPYTVFLVDGRYYCCEQGVWFVASAAGGPWAFCSSVPPAIYTIPPSHPTHNVTYVYIQESTPDTVIYNQTSGYSGEYVAATGVLMFGAGMLVGVAIADDDDYHCHSHSHYYSYGCGASYHYGYGGYYGGSRHYYGPHGGAGYGAAYNPATGTYRRGSYAYGEYGSVETRAAYNPYTGARAGAYKVQTDYGTRAGGAAYNPRSGTYARAGYAEGEYGKAGFGSAYNARTGTGVAGGAVETDRGEAAGVVTNRGTGGIKWDTENSQGQAVRTRSGDVYAGNDGTVYRRESGGGWSSNSGDGWNSAPRPSVEQEAQARSRGTQQTQRATEYRSSGSNRSSGGGGGRSGGGGGRRR